MGDERRSLFDFGNRRSGFMGGVGRSLVDIGEIGDRVYGKNL